jgi:hypothetical protein
LQSDDNTQHTRGSELATGIAAMYNKLAERCWILTLGGGVRRLCTMSTPETQKSWSSPDKSKRNTEREGGPVPPLHEFVPSILPILATANDTWYDELA